MEGTHKEPNWFRSLVMMGLSLSLAASACRASEVVFIQGPSENSVAHAELELTARFYGLDLGTFQVRTRSEKLQALTLLRSTDTLAAVISGDVIQQFPKQALLSSLRRTKARNVPLLILGFTPHSDMQQLASWSGGAMLDCHPLPAGVAATPYIVGNANQVTKELAGQEIPNLTFPACGFATDTKRGVHVLLSLRGRNENEAVFVWNRAGSQEVFFLPEMKTNDPLVSPTHLGTVEAFSRLAPTMMFVRYAAGERAWHSDAHYANLAIDDAWLTEPYGHLNYQALLAEMEAHNFHTSIAFIPWNFDRSESGVIQLFRAHLDHFSVCIHGNNHDHLEFGAYDKRPLAGQIAGIKQALARMERFHSLTSLPFDRVMIFPDEVVPPVRTLTKLKEYDFIAAANAVTVPLGSAQPADPLFPLRAVSVEFAGFPVVRRYPAEVAVSKLPIAINSFLDNPILFYGHQSLFQDGISAFDPVADAVNRIDPATRWESMGSIAQHLYLLRRRDDTNYDVLAFSSDFLLHNTLPRDVVFNVEKKEGALTAIKSLTVDGRSCPYDLSGGYLHFAVPLSAGGSSHVAMEYQNDLEVASIDVGKRSPYVALLRHVSDFRDITLSRSAWGRAMIRSYYANHIDDLELEFERSLLFLLVLAVFLIAVGWLFRKRIRARKAGAGKQPAATVQL